MVAFPAPGFACRPTPLAAALLCVLACAADGVNPLDGGWVPCSVEHTACECKGSVRYGAMTAWSVNDGVSGSIPCSSALFGDPLLGVTKHCQCKEEWMPCASESGECGCEGSVRYGASSNWIVKHGVRDTIACTTAEFGDPAPGAAKACECIAVDTCTDLTFSDSAAWHDSRGSAFTCAWYSGNSSRCPTDGRENREVFMANEACCVCGGGKRTHTEGATNATLPTVPTPVPVPVPDDWVPCSVATAMCECKGSVRYGAMTSWSPVRYDVHGSILCSPALFGDPLYGVFKHCQCKEEWMPCASENGECGCEGSVRYGASSNWTVKHNVRGTIACTTAEFGDPAPGTAKACECIAVDTCTDFSDGAAWHDSRGSAFTCAWYGGSSSRCPTDGRKNANAFTASEACCVCGGGKRTHTEGATNATLPTVPTPVPVLVPDDWVPCSVAHTACECKGSVRFGAMTSWAVKDDVSGSIVCSRAVFGDPLYGIYKHCQCKEEWMPCASENGECGCEGSVRYGASSNWIVKHGVRDTIACTTAEFGDPAPGAAKACECIAVDTCTDLTFSDSAAWHDSRGSAFTCAWYSGNSSRCPTDGRENREVFMADEACCVCGGGKRTHSNGVLPTPAPTPVPPAASTPVPESPTAVPTAAPTTPAPTASTTPVPALVPSDAPTSVVTPRPAPGPTEAPTPVPVPLPTKVPALVPSDAPTSVPTEVPSPACKDLTFSNGTAWHNSMGSTFNCSWYGSDGTLCTVGGHKYRDVHTADEACCVCGGGAPAAPGTSAPASPATNSPGSPDVDRDGSGQVAVLVGVGVGAAASVLLVGGAACAYVYLCQRRPPPRSPRRSRQCAALDPQATLLQSPVPALEEEMTEKSWDRVAMVK